MISSVHLGPGLGGDAHLIDAGSGPPLKSLATVGHLGKIRCIIFIFTCAANVPKKTSSSEASFQKVRDPQTGGEGTFVMFLAERRALVVMEADMVKVYEKNCIGFLSTVMVNV